MRKTTLTSAIAGIVIGASLIFQPTALALPPANNSSDVVDDAIAQSIASVANAPRMEENFAGLVDLQSKPPLSDAHIPEFFASDSWYPTTAPQDYAQPKLVKIVAEEGLPLERWFIESPAMRRVVELQVMRAPDANKPAPFLFALDGASAPSTSGWLRKGNLVQSLGSQQVTVIMPVQASGSMFLDWDQYDNKIQQPKWETFLTKELPTVMEDPSQGLNFNGKRAIVGLSMGASGAVRLANANPDYFHGVAGLSGCYSNSTQMGNWLTKSIIQSVGADDRKLFNPQDRVRMDPVANPTGLKNMPVYLFTADGYVTDTDIANFRGRKQYELAGGVVLEYATNVCTQELANSMASHGMQHQKVILQDGGVHDWHYYSQQLPLAWEHLAPSLY